MKTLKDYLLDEMNIEMPEGTVSGQWFRENNLPMIVECTCCKMTMALPCALIDKNGYVYCRFCGKIEE